MQSLLRAIQERKLDRVAAAYAVAAWILVQAASIALPTFGAPPWVLKVVIAAAVVGFPVAIWIAWHVAAPAQNLGEGIEALRRTDMALLGILAVVILLVGVQFAFEFGLFGTRAPAAAGEHRYYYRNAPAPPPTSVAVLPFLNLSGDPAKEYFSDGIADELLNHLASARTLRVAARTSSFAFKGKNEDIRQIARALNVGTVVEGSVREDGSHLRIAAQLIKASDGYQLWSSTYDRDLSNVLQLQDEIANAITVALTNALVPSHAAARPTSRISLEPAAYRDYLKAKSLIALKTEENDAGAVALLKQAIALQPDFADAYAALARTYAHIAQYNGRQAAFVKDADAASQQALKLDARNLEALSIHLYLATLQWNWNAASADARRLVDINPHSVFTLRGLNYYYGALGFPQQQAAVLREVTRLDPLSFVDLNNLAAVYNGRGEYAEAGSAAADALALKPDRPLTLYTLCTAYAGMSQFGKAKEIANKLKSLHEMDAADGCTFAIAAASDRFADAQQIAARIADRFPAFTFNESDIGLLYATAQDFGDANLWFGRAYDKRGWGLFSLIYSPVTPTALLKTAHWQTLMARPEARAWQAAHDRLAAELSQG